MSTVIGGKKRAQTEFKNKVIGIGEFEPFLINPDKEAIEKLFATTLEKEIEYLGEKEGVDTMRVTVYLKEKKSNDITNVSFFLEKKIRENKEDAEVRKIQWINSRCSTTWMEKAKGEDDLPAWFLKDAEARKAYVGEEELYNFLRSWIQMDWKDPEATITLDTKKLFKGNVKDLQELIGSEYTTITPENRASYPSTVVALATIKTKDTNEGVKEFQVINNRNFLPGSYIRNFQNKKYTTEDATRILSILNGDDKEAKKKVKALERFVASILDPTHGVKEFFGGSLAPLREYNSSENIATSDQVMQPATDDSDY